MREMMEVDLSGTRLACYDRGRRHSPALLLIHGFPLDRRMWKAQIDGLSRRVRVVAPDLRGQGTSADTSGTHGMELYADDLAALLDSLEIRQAIVVGLSMGGYVAFAFWRRHPERVQGLALLDTRADPDSPQAQANRDLAIARLEQIGAGAYADEMLPRLLAPANFSNARIAGRARQIMASQPVRGTIAALRALRDRPDSRPTLATIKAPVLVIAGEDDALTPPAVAREMAAGIPNARVGIVPHAGHLSPLENPRAVNRLLRQFIEEIDLRQPGSAKEISRRSFSS
jgi:3-oxoadipate enol-lactonase